MPGNHLFPHPSTVSALVILQKPRLLPYPITSFLQLTARNSLFSASSIFPSALTSLTTQSFSPNFKPMLSIRPGFPLIFVAILNQSVQLTGEETVSSPILCPTLSACSKDPLWARSCSRYLPMTSPFSLLGRTWCSTLTIPKFYFLAKKILCLNSSQQWNKFWNHLTPGFIPMV